MSLINEALKKAQHLRSRDAQSAQGAEPAQPGSGVRVRRGALPLRWVMLIIGGGAILVSASVFTTVYFVRKPVDQITLKTEERALPSARPTRIEEAPSTPTPTLALPSVEKPLVSAPLVPARVSPAPVAPAPSPAPAVAAAPAGSTDPEPLIRLPVAAREQATEPVPTPAVVPEKKAGRGTAGIQKLVDSLRVAGVRISRNEAKVLMNDRVYRLQDIVDRESGLKLVEVSAERLVFEDEQGARYVRNF